MKAQRTVLVLAVFALLFPFGHHFAYSQHLAVFVLEEEARPILIVTKPPALESPQKSTNTDPNDITGTFVVLAKRVSFHNNAANLVIYVEDTMVCRTIPRKDRTAPQVAGSIAAIKSFTLSYPLVAAAYVNETATSVKYLPTRIPERFISKVQSPPAGQ